MYDHLRVIRIIIIHVIIYTSRLYNNVINDIVLGMDWQVTVIHCMIR